MNLRVDFRLVRAGALLALVVAGLCLCLFACKEKAQETAEPSDFGQEVSLEEYPEWLHSYYGSLEWPVHRGYKKRLTRETLEQSLDLGRRFMLENQKDEGNFNYQYDWVNKKMDQSDNQVRQSGALWGVSLMYQYEQRPETKLALDKGLGFFFEHSAEGPVEGSLLIEYPGDSKCSTGTAALVGLAIIEYLRTEKDTAEDLIPEAYEKRLTEKLEGYLAFLKYMHLENKHFSREYNLRRQSRTSRYSPYFDGETMLCLIKAAKYLGYTDLIPLIEGSAMTLARDYTIESWLDEHDSTQTKGFFQWSCMAFTEYWDARWKDWETMGDYVLTLSWWMIHVHDTLSKGLNTAYVYEGLTHAYTIAKSRNEERIIDDLEYTMDRGLYKLTSWQVGGPLRHENRYLRMMQEQADDPLAIGGIMNHKGGRAPHHQLRIDVTQHQMHSVILALRHVYTDAEN